MNFEFHFLMMTIFIFFTLMVMINGLPIESNGDSNSFLRSKRSIWLKRAGEEVVDINGMIKRGVIQSAGENDFSVPSAYRFNKKRFSPIDYPINTKLFKRDQDHGVASSNTKGKQVEKREDSNSSGKTIATANLTPAAVNHTPAENNGRAAVDSKSSSLSTETKASTISLPNGVTPSSQGFLFLPVSKSSENSNKSTESTSSSSNTASQTFFFNIASPTGGSVSKFEVKGGGGEDDGKPISSPGSKANNNDVTSKPTPPAEQQSEKTRIIFKPLNDPDAQSKSVPITKPSNSNDDVQEKAGNNNSAQTKGASDPHADDKSTNDRNDEKSPTSSQSTVGANEKKNDSGEGGNSKQPSSQPKENSNHNNNNKDGGDGGNKKGGDNKDDGSGKGKGGGDGGDDNSKLSPKKAGDGGENGQTPKSQGQTGSGNGNGKGEKSETTAKNTNNDASPPKQTGSGKEDDYYLFPVESDNKTVELNKGDMVAYVDHPQLAASKVTGKPSKRNLSTFTKRSSSNVVHPNTLKRREIIHTITLTRRQPVETTTIIKRHHPIEKRPILIRSLSLAFKPIKHLFSRTNLQPGKVGVTPTYWHGQPLV